MKIVDFLRKPRKGHALCNEVTTGLMNRIFNILEGLKGCGCTVDKPLHEEGRGWKIVVDGRQSDVEPYTLPPMPFDLVWCDNCWRVWLHKAEVHVNNFECTRDPLLSVIENDDSAVTVSSYSVNDTVYLVAYAKGENKNGNDSYFWTLTTDVVHFSNGGTILAKTPIGSVTGVFSADQYTRGNQNFYTMVDSEILTIDKNQSCVRLVVHDSAYASEFATDESHQLVVRESGKIKYLDTEELAYKVCEEAEKDIINLPDGDNDLISEDELWQSIIDWAKFWPECQPAWSTVYRREDGGWVEDTSHPSYPLLGLPHGCWCVLDVSFGEDYNFVLDSEGTEVDGWLDIIEDEYKYIAEDPDDDTWKIPPGINGDEVSKYAEFTEKVTSMYSTIESLKSAIESASEMISQANSQVQTMSASFQAIMSDLASIDSVDADLENQISSLED